MSHLSRRQFFSAPVLLAGFSLIATARVRTASAAAPRVAIKGYDPVSYFEAHHPEQGSSAFTASFDDTTYWFTSAEHRDKFMADPDKYAPQYDGFCAMAVTIHQKLEPNPESWVITDGKLYVFGEPPPGFPPAVPYFRAHTAELLKAGDDAWPTMRKSP